MNNSYIISNTLSEDSEVDAKSTLRQRQTKLLEILDAIDRIKSSVYWSVLQKNIFEDFSQNLKRRISHEKDTTEIFRLQGEIKWADKFADLDHLRDIYRIELEAVKRKLL